MKVSVEPIADIVFVEPRSVDGRIQIIDPRADFRGEVVAVGPGRPLPEGGHMAMSVQVGDIVRIAPSRAIEAVFDQRRVLITREREILAVEDAA